MPEKPASVNPSAWSRVSAQTLKSETERRGTKPGMGPHPGPYSGIVVEVTGPPIAVTTTTPTSTTPAPTSTTTTTTTSTVDEPEPTTSTTTTTTTTSCITGSLTSSTTSTTADQKFVYPGRFVYRSFDHTTNQEWWYPGETCWIQETNNQALGLGCRYPGQLIMPYGGMPTVAVKGTNSAVSCTSTTTSTTPCGCSGHCVWELQSGEGILSILGRAQGPMGLIDGSEAGEEFNWVLTSNTCHAPSGCDCPQPDFCPQDGGCATAVTFCSHGGDPEQVIVTCTDPNATTTTTTTTSGTGTTVTSTTTTTTTTTPDEGDCGLGCIWKLIPNLGYILIMSDCDVGLELGEGWVCGSCIPLPEGGIPPCVEFPVPCELIPPPPPPTYFCQGFCTWVWTDIEGDWWHLVGGPGCFSNFIDGRQCICEPPSMPGDECNQLATTPCGTIDPPTTTGTGTTTTTTTTSGTGSSSTTTTTTTTTAGGCGGFCQMRWDTVTEEWYAILDCGSDCGCTQPFYDGSSDCDVVKVPCVHTTTTSTTTTTTTTTPAPCTGECLWECTVDSKSYEWTLIDSSCSDPGCECSPPPFPCGIGNLGNEESTDCYATTTTTSTTTTTTTTTPDIGPPCCGETAGCIYQCAFSGFDDFGQPLYAWSLCANRCGAGFHCRAGLCNFRTICSALTAGRCTVCPCSPGEGGGDSSTSNTFTTSTLIG